MAALCSLAASSRIGTRPTPAPAQGAGRGAALRRVAVGAAAGGAHSGGRGKEKEEVVTGVVFKPFEEASPCSADEGCKHTHSLAGWLTDRRPGWRAQPTPPLALGSRPCTPPRLQVAPMLKQTAGMAGGGTHRDLKANTSFARSAGGAGSCSRRSRPLAALRLQPTASERSHLRPCLPPSLPSQRTQRPHVHGRVRGGGERADQRGVSCLPACLRRLWELLARRLRLLLAAARPACFTRRSPPCPHAGTT